MTSAFDPLEFEFAFSKEAFVVKAVCGDFELTKSYDTDVLRELTGGLPVTTLFNDDFVQPVAEALGRDPDGVRELFESAGLKALQEGQS